MSENCLFCKIASGVIPATLIYQDELLVAFPDINPMAPTHVLVIPRKHLIAAIVNIISVTHVRDIKRRIVIVMTADQCTFLP